MICGLTPDKSFNGVELMSEEEEHKDPDFVIRDKRGSQKSDEEIREQEKESSASSDTASGESDSQQQVPPQDIKIDFSTFVLSLTSSAFYHLGDIADPHTGEKKVDLTAVKQTIEILILLQDKTKGNLSNDEAKLLEQLIYELQMKFVAKKPK